MATMTEAMATEKAEVEKKEYKPFFTKLSDLPTEELFGPGHRLCSGCGPAIAMRMMTKAFRGPTIVFTATGCVEVSSTPYPYTAWGVPWAHVLFQNVAASASGCVEAINKMAEEGRAKKADVIAIGGDGGIVDIGIAAVSGALERNHDMVIICYDNQAYNNTGIQRSGATPLGAWTTTSEVGKAQPGKTEWQKDILGVAIVHGIPYAASATIADWRDYILKVRRAIEVDGPAFIHVLAPCQLGWRFDSSQTINIARLAIDTRFFPVYEYADGVYTINRRVPSPKPVEEFLKTQGRFGHLFEEQNRWLIKKIQEGVDRNWQRLVNLERATNPNAPKE
ncbi:MAG: thiamine pyrophosphate-dependent enzyme [Thermoproteota archaeon]